MSILIGSSNIDGSGSAANLIDLGGTELEYSDLTSEFLNVDGNKEKHYAIVLNSGVQWNDPGVKEIYIDEYLDYDRTYISGFVDVFIKYPETDGIEETDLSIGVCKRGYIDTTALGNSNDEIRVSMESNSGDWSNLLEVFTGDGNDEVEIRMPTNFDDDDPTNKYIIDVSATYSEFNVNLGSGNDVFSYRNSAMTHFNDSVSRYVDGGDGTDIIYISKSIYDLNFSNFEAIISNPYYDNLEIAISEQQLANNGVSNIGTIVNDISISIIDDYTSITVESLSTNQENYISSVISELENTVYHDNNTYSFDENLDNYYAVTITYQDSSYTLLTNEINEDWL